MDVQHFVNQHPCLDEIDGYRKGRQLLGNPITAEEARPLLEWEASLKSGKAIPARIRDAGQNWVYVKGKKPRPQTSGG